MSTSAVLGVSLLITSVGYLYQNNTIRIIFSILVVMTFQLGPGPMMWVYINEITCEKSGQVATATNWIANLIITLTSPFICNSLGTVDTGYYWMILGAITLAGVVFM